MFRRLYAVAAMFLFFAAHSLAAEMHAAGERPNVLFVIADDWGYPFAGAYGDPVVKTPHFDRIAREGALCTHAFIAAPSCSPSRAAILTGQHPWRLAHGANLHGFIAAKFDVFPDLLEAAGYFVGYSKKGYGPGNKGDRPRNPCGPTFKDFATFLKQRPDGKPFCYWYGSIEPHRPYEWEAGIKAGMDPAKVKVPAYWPDNATTRTDIVDYHSEVQQQDQQLGDVLATLEATGELDRTLIIVTGDHGRPFPRGKTNLYDEGTRVPLAIRWPKMIPAGTRTDELISSIDFAPTILEACGLKPTTAMTGHSLLPLLAPQPTAAAEKVNREDLLLGLERHVACHLLESGVQAGYPARALRTKEFLLIHNFHPERWPAGDPAQMAAPRSQWPSDADLRKDTKLAFADCDAGPTKAFILLNRDDEKIKPYYDLCFAKRPEWELYDLRRDPEQVRNVAAEKAYEEQFVQLKAGLQRSLEDIDDPRAKGVAGTPLDELPANLK